MPLGLRVGQQAIPPDVTIRVWDAATGKELAKFELEQVPSHKAIALSPDGRKLFVAKEVVDRTKPHGSEARQFLYDVDTRKELWSTRVPLPLTFAEFSADGRLLLAFNNSNESGAVSLAEQRLFYWDVATGQVSCMENENSHLTAAHFRPGTHQALWALNTGLCRLADLDPGKVLWSRQAHARAVQHLEFSADGRYFVTVTEDHTTRVWDTDAREEVLTLSNPRYPIQRAHFRPDGRELLTVTEDGAVRLLPIDPLPLALSRRPRELSPEARQGFEVRR
jgi:WD40 repeat protein